jgi:soluble lytic murein transglycosylase-like protein
MVKIFQSLFGGQDKSTEKADKKSGSAFKDMLARHLEEARIDAAGHVPDSRIGQGLQDLKQPVQQNFADNTTATDGENPSAETPEIDAQAEFESHQTNLEMFVDKDPFYQKGVKNKTLSETYSSRVGSSTDERLGKIKHLIESKAQKYNLDPNLLAGLVKQESNFNPYAVSWCGAMGLGQLMPETARALGVKDPFNAAQNLDGAAKYLRQMMDSFGGNVDKALAAYNAGPGAVIKHGGVPPFSETQNYVKVIKGNRASIAKADYFPDKKKPSDVA